MTRSIARTPCRTLVSASLFVSCAGPLAAAQAGASGHADEARSRRPASDRIEIVDDPGSKTLTISLGPIDLPAGISHHELHQIPVQEGTVPFDFTIRGYRAEAYDERGRRVPQDVIHHMNLLDPERRELFEPIMLRVLAASHETKPVRLPGWLFGIPMREGSKFIALTMLHNPTSESYRGVRVHLVLEYERAEPLPIYPVVPWHLDTMFPLGRKAFDLPPGHTARSYEARPVVRGLILGLGGHLHRYATRLMLRDVTTDEILYDVEPDLDEEGHIEAIPMLLHRGRGLGLLVEPDHVYRVTAEYFNPTGDTIPDGGMGAVAGAFLPLEPWPAANPRDALYAADYDWVLASLDHERGETGAHGHGASAARRPISGPVRREHARPQSCRERPCSGSRRPGS